LNCALNNGVERWENCEYERNRIWKQSTITSFNILSSSLLHETEENGEVMERLRAVAEEFRKESAPVVSEETYRLRQFAGVYYLIVRIFAFNQKTRRNEYQKIKL
jgi:hypothetical protein